MKHTLPLAILLFVGAASAQVTADPGETVVFNENTTNKSIVSSSPFDASIQNQNISVDLPNDLAPKQYTETVQFNNSTETYSIDINENFNYSINQTSFSENINLGATGQLNPFSLVPEGNTDGVVDASLSGNVSEIINIPPSFALIQGVNTDVSVNYQVGRTQDTGTYTGNITLTRNNDQRDVDLELSVQDRINPEIENLNVEGYESFTPSNFTVVPSDNAGIERVNATIFEVVNESRDRRETFQLNDLPNNDVYSFKPNINKPGDYSVDFNITDIGGNTVSATDSFTVLRLDAVDVRNQRTVEMDVFRTGSTNEVDLGSITADTDVEIELDEFSSEVDDSSYQISVFSDSEGPEFFNSVNDTVLFTEAANLSLRVESEEAEQFNGRLEFDGLQYHEDVDPVTFAGEFLDCRVPQADRFQVLNRNVTLEPRRSDSCTDSGWEISYFAEAQSVPTDAELENSINILVPQEIKEQQRIVQEQIIEERESTIQVLSIISGGLLFSLVVAVYSILFAVYQLPYMFHFDVSRSEKLRKVLSRREELGV